MRSRLTALATTVIVILCMTWMMTHPYSISNLMALAVLCMSIIVAGDIVMSDGHKHGRQTLHHKQQSRRHPVHKSSAGLSPLARRTN